MRSPQTIVFLLVFVFVLVVSVSASAGFGITPPYVRNEILSPGVLYEQKIIMVRGDPNSDARLKILFDVPGANDWFTTDPPVDSVIPAGEKQVPLLVRVLPPKGAKIARYTGRILITLDTADMPSPGTVGIISGAQADVDVMLTDEKVSGFKVRDSEVLDTEEGYRVWWFFFPGKIIFTMQIENTGNIPVAPAGVRLDIYDVFGKKLLETARNLNVLKPLKPFMRDTVRAEIPTRLGAGNYRVKAYIDNGTTEIYAGEHALHVSPYGSVSGHEGYGFAGL